MQAVDFSFEVVLHGDLYILLYLMFNEVPWDSDQKVQATSKVT